MTSVPDEQPESKRRIPLEEPTIKLWPKIAAGLIAMTIIVVLIWGPVELAETLIEWWQQETGPVGAIGFVAFYIAATTVFVPAAVLGVGAGFLFGGLWGGLIAAFCRPLGALVAFVIGRHLARDHVREWIEDWPRFGVVDRMTREEPFRIVMLLRLVPVLTFNITNYVFGLTAVDWKNFFTATFVGVLPGSLFYVYIGAATGDLTRALALEEAPPLEDYLVTWIIGGVAIIAVLSYMTYRARQYWLEIMEEEENVEGQTNTEEGETREAVEN